MTGKRMWCSKADIMKDLAKVTGSLDDVDEECIAFGKKPPPVRRLEEDGELDYRFGTDGVTDGVTDNSSRHLAPDLYGIMEMIRMVNEFNDNEESEDPPEPGVQEVVTISKLNPDVPEFVPNRATSPSVNCKKNVNSVEISEKCPKKSTDSEVNDSDTKLKEAPISESKKEPDTYNDINIDKRIDVTKLNPDEIFDSIKKIKSKISKNQGCRRQKNVAIATLLKLYAAAPKSSQSASPTPAQTPNGIKSPEPEPKPIVLFTPEYFEKRYANGNSKAEDVQCTSEIQHSTIEEDIKPKSNTDETTRTIDVGTSCSTGISSPESSEKSSVEELKSDPQVRESIRKVNMWLEQPAPTKPKVSTICLNPISFKKKDLSKSPSVTNSDTSTSSKQNIKQTAEFRPSKYAEDLSKKFMERSKVIEQRNQDMWTRVQNEMKAKEEKLKQQKEEQSSNKSVSNNDDSNDGSR